MTETPLTTQDEKNRIGFMNHFFKLHSVSLIVLLVTIVAQFFLIPQVTDAGEMTIQGLTKCTNEIRLKHLDNQLFLHPKLTIAAENKLNDMAQYHYWAHENPTTSKKPWDFVDEAGYYYETTGENLAIGFENSEEICQAWEKSSKHFENIVNPAYQEIGFAIDKANLRKDARGILVVLMFGSRMDFTGPVQSSNVETQQFCEFGDTFCGQEGVPQVEGTTTQKNPPTVKESSAEKLKNNILFVIGFSLLPWIFIVVFKKMSPKKIALLVVIAGVITIVAINFKDINKYIFNTAKEIQSSVIQSNNPTVDSVEGRVDVKDVENSSMTRAPLVQK